MPKNSFLYGLESEYDYDKVKEKSHDTRQIGLSKYITFSEGKFDKWCVYLVKRGKDQKFHAYAPHDTYYFERIYWLGTNPRLKLSLQKVYRDFLYLYYISNENTLYDENGYKIINDEVLRKIHDLCVNDYKEEWEIAEEQFCLVYYGMIAEENKKNSIIGSAMKMYGLHDLLISQRGIEASACHTKCKHVKNIFDEYKNIGIVPYHKNC